MSAIFAPRSARPVPLAAPPLSEYVFRRERPRRSVPGVRKSRCVSPARGDAKEQTPRRSVLGVRRSRCVLHFKVSYKRGERPIPSVSRRNGLLYSRTALPGSVFPGFPSPFCFFCLISVLSGFSRLCFLSLLMFRPACPLLFAFFCRIACRAAGFLPAASFRSSLPYFCMVCFNSASLVSARLLCSSFFLPVLLPRRKGSPALSSI